MENHKLCNLVQGGIPTGFKGHPWNLRADYQTGHHHQTFNLNDSPLYLDFNWRKTADDPVQHVGIFRLDLKGLLSGGYIRWDKPDRHGSDRVRVRILRENNGGFVIQTKQTGPKLLLPGDPSALKDIKKPIDFQEPPPQHAAWVSRFIRDTPGARKLKRLYGFACQVCDLVIETTPGSFYIEVHHIRPLGGGHASLDIQSNMLVLCPNHHPMFDFGIPRFQSPQRVEIAGITHKLTVEHDLSPQSIAYHNSHVTSPPF